jgi:hypothetical protein
MYMYGKYPEIVEHSLTTCRTALMVYRCMPCRYNAIALNLSHNSGEYLKSGKVSITMHWNLLYNYDMHTSYNRCPPRPPPNPQTSFSLDRPAAAFNPISYGSLLYRYITLIFRWYTDIMGIYRHLPTAPFKHNIRF